MDILPILVVLLLIGAAYKATTPDGRREVIAAFSILACAGCTYWSAGIVNDLGLFGGETAKCFQAFFAVIAVVLALLWIRYVGDLPRLG